MLAKWFLAYAKYFAGFWIDYALKISIVFAVNHKVALHPALRHSMEIEA